MSVQSAAILPDLKRLYLVKADRKDTPLQEDISELKDIFGCKIELLPIKQHTAPKEVLDALPIAKNLMSAYSSGYIRGNAEFRLILETSKEQLSRTKKMTGFSSFKEAFRRINSLSDRMIELGKRGNYLCEGYGAQRLCRYLAEQGITNRKGRNIPTTSINRIIKNPIYTGVIRNGDSQSEVLPELQIIDAETYERAQQMMEKRVT